MKPDCKTSLAAVLAIFPPKLEDTLASYCRADVMCERRLWVDTYDWKTTDRPRGSQIAEYQFKLDQCFTGQNFYMLDDPRDRTKRTRVDPKLVKMDFNEIEKRVLAYWISKGAPAF